MESNIVRYFIKNQVVLALTLVVVGWFIFHIREILLFIFVSYIILAALKPYVEFLRKYKVPKVLAVSVSYLITVGVIILLIVPLVPFFISQVTSLFEKFPVYLEQAARFLRIETGKDSINNILGGQIGTISANAFTVTSILFGGLFSFILIIVLSFYMLLDHERLKHAIAEFFPVKSRGRVLTIFSQIDERLGAWARGQVVLSLTIGIFTWIALTLLGFGNVALPLAILAGMLEIVPTLGPILAAVPAIIIALAVSPSMTIAVILSYILIQILENNLLVPKIMQRAVGINPIVVIIGITIGANLMGILGALLSIPFISMIIILYRNLIRYKETDER